MWEVTVGVVLAIAVVAAAWVLRPRRRGKVQPLPPPTSTEAAAGGAVEATKAAGGSTEPVGGDAVVGRKGAAAPEYVPPVSALKFRRVGVVALSPCGRYAVVTCRRLRRCFVVPQGSTAGFAEKARMVQEKGYVMMLDDVPLDITAIAFTASGSFVALSDILTDKVVVYEVHSGVLDRLRSAAAGGASVESLGVGVATQRWTCRLPAWADSATLRWWGIGAANDDAGNLHENALPSCMFFVHRQSGEVEVVKSNEKFLPRLRIKGVNGAPTCAMVQSPILLFGQQNHGIRLVNRITIENDDTMDISHRNMRSITTSTTVVACTMVNVHAVIHKGTRLPSDSFVVFVDARGWVSVYDVASHTVVCSAKEDAVASFSCDALHVAVRRNQLVVATASFSVSRAGVLSVVWANSKKELRDVGTPLEKGDVVAAEKSENGRVFQVTRAALLPYVFGVPATDAIETMSLLQGGTCLAISGQSGSGGLFLWPIDV